MIIMLIYLMKACNIIHNNGGQVYLDGRRSNAYGS